MNTFTELMDIDTLVAVRKQAPQITAVPFDAARLVVRALDDYSRLNQAHEDADGKKYWQASLKDVHAAGHLRDDFAMKSVGTSCREIGLTVWRKMDGFYVAWSDEQLKLLKKHFKV